MNTYPFHQLDVFTATPLKGNPLAVIHAANDLDDATMASIARWTNLSETTFLQTPTHPQADYKVRIFTPGGELPFAGHPTLGSCFAWLEQGGVPKQKGMVVQECGIGLVNIRQTPGKLAFAAPPLRKTGALDEPHLAQIAAGLGIARADIVHHQWVDNGPGWCAVMLPTAQAVLDVKPDASILSQFKLGVIGPYPQGHDLDYEVRAFVYPLGVKEDPVTGSLNAGIATWLIGAGLAKPAYTVSQGTALQRQGRIYIEQDGADIWVGGQVARCVVGQMTV